MAKAKVTTYKVALAAAILGLHAPEGGMQTDTCNVIAYRNGTAHDTDTTV